MPAGVYQIQAMWNMKWIGELDIIMQRDCANLLYNKVPNKHGEQLNSVRYDIGKDLWDLLHSDLPENIEFVESIKIQNDCDSLELIFQDNAFLGFTDLIWTLSLRGCLMVI